MGDKAQLAAYQSIAKLKLEYAQFEELESFARFGTRLDEDTRKTIEHGKRIRESLRQDELQQLTAIEQIFILLSLKNGLLDNVAIEKIKDAENALLKNVSTIPDEIQKTITSNKKLSDDDIKTMLKIATDLLVPFQDKPGADQNKT